MNYKPYSKYKPSGEDWIGDIPQNWDTISFRFVTDLMTCGHAATPVYVNEDEGVMFLSAQNIQNEKIDLTKYNYITRELHHTLTKNHKVEKGDLLQVRVGGESTVGQTAIVDFDFDGSIYVSLSHIKLNEKAFNGYIKYLCNSTRYREFSSVVMKKGAGVANFNVTDQRLIKIPIPPKEEQTAIADFLDEKTAKIDSLIEKKKQLIELLKEERTAIINQSVTKGIDPNVKLKPSGIDWLGDIPEHWEVKKLKYVGDINLGKMLTSEDKGGYYLKPYLRAANIEWLYVNVEDVKEMWFSKPELEKLRIKHSDLLVSEGGEVGRTCIWKNELEECYIQNSVHKITLLQNHIPEFFLYQMYLLGSIGFFESIVNRISIAHLTGEKIKEIPVWHPEQNEQQEIVNHIENESKRINNTIDKIEKEIELLQEYRTALISEAVTGKIKVI